MAKEYAATVYNNTVDTLRHVIEVAIERGAAFENPARHVSKRRVGLKQLLLPSQEQFHALVQSVQSADMGHSREYAELIRFLAFTGCRKGEAAQVKWADVDFERGSITVRGDPEHGTKNRDDRVVPMIPACRELLEELRAQRPEESPDELVMKVHDCQKAINRAVKELSIARFTHHDLRHLYATRCIESGVDIPTVARWLGHKDGGGLAMRVYGHLRIEHSQQMAQKVRF
jgi:integrase